MRRQFPFLGRVRGGISLRWSFAQLVGALPFSVTNFVELGLSYLSVLLIGFFVTDRIAIAQWSLTRTIVNLLRQVSYQTTLPLAAELGHDHAIGARDSLQRLYVRGSVILVAGRRRGHVRRAGILAGFLRDLDPWRDSL